MGFEERFRELVLQPFAPLIPKFVSPNFLTCLSMVSIVMASVLGALTPHITDPVDRLRSACGASFAILTYMSLDCLDGMHARRHGMTSKFGEMLDHATDAVGVPAASFAVSWAIQHDTLSTFASATMASLIYHTQFILFHKTGRLELAAADGVVAQLGAAVIIVVFNSLMFTIPRDDATVVYALWVVTGVSLCIMVMNVTGYVWSAGDTSWKAIGFIVPAAVTSAIYLADGPVTDLWGGNVITFLPAPGDGWMSGGGASALITCISFRATGQWVFAVMANRPYLGLDPLVMAGTLISGVAHMQPTLFPADSLPFLPYALSAVYFVSTCADGLSTLAQLKPKPKQG